MSVFAKNYNNIANNNNNIININNNNNINNSPIRRDMTNTIQHNGNNNINNNINNVSNNNININNTNNDSNIIGNSDALGHYLWQCGMWTSCTQEARYLEGSLYFQPQLAIIEPKTLQNVNILSYKSPNNNNNNNNIPNVAPTHSFDDLASLQSGISFNNNNNNNNYNFNNIRNNIGNIHNVHNLNTNSNNRNNTNNNKNIRKLGSFKDYVFFSNHRTSKFQRRLGSYGQNIEFQSVYQFEARYFQYSILRGNVRFVKNYTLNTEYLVFKFGRSAQYISRNYNNNNNNNKNNNISIEYGSLYGICELNDRHPERQPWCCQDILSKDELLRHFGLQNCSFSVQNGFLRFIDIDDNCVRKEFDSSMDYNPNVKKITRMLKHGFYDYIKGLERRNFNNLSNNYSNNCDNSSSDDSVHSVVSCPPKYCGNNSRFYGKKSGLNNNNSNKYCRNSNGARGARGRKNSRRNRARNARNGSRVVKLKNEDKFSYLKSIADNMGVSWNEFLLRLGWSIIDAFEFARLNSNTVLTQAYIDEENGTMSFELVLFAEIYDEVNKKYYKFAVPIVEQQNKETKQWYYIAKNILTPKMAIDNIRLNSLHGQLPKHPWIESIYEDNRSYFRQFNGVWYETRDSRDMTKYYAWINSVINDNKRNNGNNGYNSNNSKDKPQTGGLDGEISRILGSMLGGGNSNSKLGFVLGFDLMESDNDSCFASKESSVVSVSDCGGGGYGDYCGDSITGIESIANSNEMENDEKIQIINTNANINTNSNAATVTKHTQQQQTGLISGARARRGSVTIGTIDKIDTVTCTRGRGRRSSVKINIDAPPVDTECKTNENNNNNNSISNNKNSKNSKKNERKAGRSSLNVSATEFFRSLTPDHFDSSLSDSEYNNNSNPLAPSLATLKLGDIVRFGSF